MSSKLIIGITFFVIIISLCVVFYIFKRRKNDFVIEDKNANEYYKDNLDEFAKLNKDNLEDNKVKEFLVEENIILIEDQCFVNCKNLVSIKVHKDNCNYLSKLGVLFSRDMNNLIFYPPLKQTHTYFIPQGVNYINSYSFFNNHLVKYVVIPTSLEYIDENAFVNCTCLNQIVIPKNVLHIHPRAFSLCPKLTIRCYDESVAKDYCEEFYIPFEVLNE